MTQLCTGLIYHNPYLSQKNAEFLIHNGFECQYLDGCISFSIKGHKEVHIENDTLIYCVKVLGYWYQVAFYEGIDLTLKEFAILLLDLCILEKPFKIEGVYLLLKEPQFNLENLKN